MTIATPRTFEPFHSLPNRNSRSGSKARVSEMSFRLCSAARAYLTDEEAQMRRVSAALWRAFPEADSENDLCDMASPYFRNKRGEPVSPRTIKYWLREETLPNHNHTLTLIAMVGFEWFFPLPDDGRAA